MNQNTPSPHTTPQHPQPQPSFSDQESQCSSIHQEQLTQALKTVRKLKKIFKQRKMTEFKTRNQVGNRLMGEMSLFFHTKLNQKVQMKKQKQETKKEARQNRLRTELRKAKNQMSRQLAGQMKAIEQEGESRILSEPEIVQDPQPSNNTEQFHLRCHICKQLYEQTHHFYGYLCPQCATLNYTKRTQKADLNGLTALVTGGRIKIGFEICLKLLRDGARVFVTTRFPNDALIRYQAQQDYQIWKDRLHLIACDFLSQAQVNCLIQKIKDKVAKLDILINNAAQTLVRPKEFYHQELERQRLSIESPNLEPTLALQRFTNPIEQFPSIFANDLVTRQGDISTQQRDQFDQPIDRRQQNSWTQSLDEVDLKDCFTTQVINSIVPFHLIGQFKPIMTGQTPSWVINVSSMEGVFYRSQKSHNHPHTNMAKASLNMITRTSAQDFMMNRIYMNSVDTGWVTNENPFHVAEHQRQKHLFTCPLDCVDGAMRVLDPIYQGVLKGKFPWGQFIKNYDNSFW